MPLFSCDVAFLIVRSPVKHGERSTAGLPYLHGCVGSLPEIDLSRQIGDCMVFHLSLARTASFRRCTDRDCRLGRRTDG
jgi:hypothetical protein